MILSDTKPSNQIFFDTNHLKSDLKTRSVQSGTITMVAQIVKFLLHLGSTVILLRLLTPSDFGLVAMVTAVIGFVGRFKDIGLSMATIQRAKINHDQISTLFWINLTLGVTLMLLTAALAPAIAWYYGEARLMWITLVLATAFVFGGLTIQHQALVRRHMHFGYLALVQIAAMLIGVVIAIVSALLGAGYWALIMMQLGTGITTCIGVWLFCRWRPGRPVRTSKVRDMLSFGGNLTGFNVVNYFTQNLDKILIGRYCGSVSLGLYSKAYQIIRLPLENIRSPLLSVAIPALSQLQDAPGRYRNYYKKLLLILSLINMPIVAFLFVCSESVVYLLGGDRWVAMNDIFKVFAIASFIQPVSGTRGLIFVSLGQTRRYLRWGIFNSIFIVTFFIIGLQWGALGVATAYTIAVYVILLPGLWYCFRFTHVSIGDFFNAIWRSITASFIMATVIFLCLPLIIEQAHYIRIVICFAIGLSVYLLVWLIIPGGIERLREIYSYFPLIFRRMKPPQQKNSTVI